VREASRFVLAVVRIERRLCCKREEAEGIFSACTWLVFCDNSSSISGKEPTDVVCISEVGSCTTSDLDVLEMMAEPIRASALRLLV
jgi:hypothetical protein